MNALSVFIMHISWLVKSSTVGICSMYTYLLVVGYAVLFHDHTQHLLYKPIKE